MAQILTPVADDLDDVGCSDSIGGNNGIKGFHVDCSVNAARSGQGLDC